MINTANADLFSPLAIVRTSTSRSPLQMRFRGVTTTKSERPPPTPPGTTSHSNKIYEKKRGG